MFEDQARSCRRQPGPTEGYGGDMALRAHDVAQELRRRLPGVPTKKLHKLLYYCQGHHLASRGDTLFSDSIQAWDMGPVVAVLWHQEREAGPSGDAKPLSEEQLNTVGYVVSRYGRLSGTDLEHLTHAEDPWLRADRGRQPGESARIEPDWMREYFVSSVGDGADAPDLPERRLLSAWLAAAPQRRSDPLSPDSPAALQARLADAG
jgi:uncharacterized phage-associated protein